MKFKVGDRVVIVAPEGVTANNLIGNVYTVEEVDPKMPHPYRLSDGYFHWSDEELELESVYNSELYQLLYKQGK